MDRTPSRTPFDLTGTGRLDQKPDFGEVVARLLGGETILIHNGQALRDLRLWFKRRGRTFHKELTEPVGRVARAWLDPQQEGQA